MNSEPACAGDSEVKSEGRSSQDSMPYVVSMGFGFCNILISRAYTSTERMSKFHRMATDVELASGWRVGIP